MTEWLNDRLVWKNHQKPIKKQILKDERQPFKVKEFLARRKVIYILTIVNIIILSILTNALINYVSGVIYNFQRGLGEKVTPMNIGEKLVSLFDDIGQLFTKHVSTSEMIINTFLKPNQHLLIWLLLFALLSMLMIKKIHKFYVAHRKLDYGQKGKSEFAKLKDLKKQYVSVPQQVKEYKGQPGVPITHFNDVPKILQIPGLNKIFYNGRYLIDQDTINTMIIGTSRSGKGESVVFPATDIDTRASEKPSLVFNDPKGELYAGSYETLRKRGYDVEVLNLVNPDDGMSYNMLQIIKDEYIKGDFSKAEAYAVSLASTLFQTEDGSDFWEKSGASLLVALIFAVIQRSLEENAPEKITMRNVYDLLVTLGSQNWTDELGAEHNALAEYMMSLPDDSIAKKQYATTEFAGGNTRASILATATSTLAIFVSEQLSKMGSANSLDFTRVGFNKRFRIRFDTHYIYKRGVIHYGYGQKDSYQSNFKVDHLGYTENYFRRKMKNGDVIRIEIDGDNFEFEFHREKKKSGFVSIDPYTKERVYPDEAYLKPKDRYVSIISAKCFYSEKPVAVFMVIPDFDTSLHVVASIFISQLYTILARRANESGGKCHQRVKFRLDEFGNMPAIHDMSNILTVCLGRNILFELYVQGYSQVFAKYGDKDAETIKDNCQNHIYIKSTSKETNEEISAKCGNRTVTTSSRDLKGGSDFSLNFSTEQAPLIHPEDLPKFVRGETIVLRFLKTGDNERNSVRPEPIYNTNEMKFPFRFEFLGDDFEPANQFADFDIPSKHRHINLGDYRIDWNHKPLKYEKQAKSYIAGLDLTNEQLKRLKMICGSEQLYEKLIQVPEKEYLFSAMNEYQLDKMIVGSDAQLMNARFLKLLNEFEGVNTESETDTQDREAVSAENETIYVSELYFGTSTETTRKLLKDQLDDIMLYEELMQMNKKEFKRTLSEKGQEDLFNQIEALMVNSA
ncbi:VirD4-like conjugal transfer protein, CD1115 family [Macrococcus bovicus]|uniref:VirD4-like conjugal transfer protein, CD1115 family n=1 Tax=Macrococcus bovicus TaxID=69968 RepID=UPI0025A63A70|nr:type IV secretory system conjugative DNA transfer family protein [Macrococcus bovicus]WJP96727.1 type IV secretory system conjugative DNA transfer family protein [Macrococcus bovicus]